MGKKIVRKWKTFQKRKQNKEFLAIKTLIKAPAASFVLQHCNEFKSARFKFFIQLFFLLHYHSSWKLPAVQFNRRSMLAELWSSFGGLGLATLV